jgi:hypothetical protein
MLHTHKRPKEEQLKLRAPTNRIKQQEKDFQWENKLEYFAQDGREKKLQNDFLDNFFLFTHNFSPAISTKD